MGGTPFSQAAAAGHQPCSLVLAQLNDLPTGAYSTCTARNTKPSVATSLKATTTLLPTLMAIKRHC